MLRTRMTTLVGLGGQLFLFFFSKKPFSSFTLRTITGVNLNGFSPNLIYAFKCTQNVHLDDF